VRRTKWATQRVDADQRISRTTSEGRTELDVHELLNTDHVRRTYEAFQKLHEMMRKDALNDELKKMQNFSSQLAGSSGLDQMRDSFSNIDRILDEMQRASRMPERHALQDALDTLQGVKR